MYALYILECADGTLYTGITIDLDRRIREHNSSTGGAKYTRSRRPVILKFYKRFRNRSTASQAEYRVKHLTRVQKIELIHSATYAHPLR